uniref:Pep3/Vps18 beta-propeller domain-containing protein n=1 Tax=Anguilla anguilla TaxID=7936 RepID=A0A0E9UEB1_ANGAN
MSLGKDTLLRIDLGKPDQPNQVELGRKDEAKVHKLFLDHTGCNLMCKCVQFALNLERLMLIRAAVMSQYNECIND